MNQTPDRFGRRTLAAAGFILILLAGLAAGLAPAPHGAQPAALATPTATPAFLDLPPASPRSCPPRVPAQEDQPLLRIGLGTVRDFALTPDARDLAVASGGELVVYDMSSLQPVWTAPLDTPPVRVTYSLDGGRIAATLDDGRVTLWGAASGRLLWSVRDACDDLEGLGFSADGRLLAVGGQNGVIHLVDASDGALVSSLYVNGGVKSLAFSPDGRWLAASDGGVVTLWDARSWQVVWSRQAGNAVTWARDSSKLGIRRGASYIVLSVPGWQEIDHDEWQPFSPSPQFPPEFDDHTSGARSSADGRTEVYYMWEFNILNAYDTQRKQERTIERGWLQQALFLPDNRHLLVIDHGAMSAWDVAAGTPVFVSDLQERLGGMALSPDGAQVAVSQDDRSSVLFWDVASQRWTGRRFDAPYDDVWRMTFNPDGRWLAAGVVERLVKGEDFLPEPKSSAVVVWDRATGRIARTIPLDKYASPVLDFTPDSAALLIHSLKATLRWEPSGDRLIALPLEKVIDPPDMSLTSPDGRWALFGSGDRDPIFLLDAKTRAVVRRLGQARHVETWSADSRWLATTSRDGVLQVWALP